MPDLNRSTLLLTLTTVLTVAVAFQAYELSTIRSDLREATTVLRAMAGGQSVPIAHTSAPQATTTAETAPEVGLKGSTAASGKSTGRRVRSTVRPGQLPPTVDKTYTPKPAPVVDSKDPCTGACRVVFECGLHNGRCPGLSTKAEATIRPLCLAACRGDAALRTQLTGKSPCDGGLTALRGQVPALDAACVHGIK